MRAAERPHIATVSRALVLAIALACALPAVAAAANGSGRWTIRSPDRRIAATIVQPRPGAPLRLAVARDGRRLLTGGLGLDTSRGSLVRGLALTGQRRGSVTETFSTSAGKRRLHHEHARTLTLDFRHGDIALRLLLRVSDDGVAYRYALPGRGPLRIERERSSFAAPAGTRAWLQRYTSNYEATYDPVRLGAARPGRYALPALLDLGRGAWALLSESDVAGSAAAHLTATKRDGVLHVTPEDSVQGRRPLLLTPWRVAVVGDLATVVESDLVDRLGGRTQIADTSWIVPGRVAWSWWSDSGSPGSLERQLAYVDFAASLGWEYVLVDAGWNPAWVPALVEHARARGVRVLLWADWLDLATQAQQDALLDLWQSWGVAGVKIDFPQSDGQERMAWFEQVAASAAARRLVLDFHGCTLPRGIQRRWPNVLTMEAVLGAEGGDAITPAHTTTLPFTRNAVGSMDFTPVAFSGTHRSTTLAHQLALAVVFESGLQAFADSPEAYAAQPLAIDVLRDVPAAWDDVRFVAGYPGRSATLARRRGDDWWVGSISARPATSVTVRLGFLTPGRRYDATIVTDAPGGGLRRSERTVRASDTLTLPLAADGGAVATLTAR